jgi:deoxyribose-phosphate aldolase
MQSSRASNGAIGSPRELAPFIDHTLLKADAIEDDIVKLCGEAETHHFKAVCVNPIFVRKTRELLARTPVLTASVIGFPLGASLSRIKALEAELACRDGASEIDMVIRIDLIKTRRWNEAEADISEVVQAVAGAPVKVILETGLLTTDEIREACRLCENAGAAFVKTATGFLGRGATLEDVQLMREVCSPRVQIKASGGVKTFEQAKALIQAGATRIGTSSGVSLVTSGESRSSGY